MWMFSKHTHQICDNITGGICPETAVLVMDMFKLGALSCKLNQSASFLMSQVAIRAFLQMIYSIPPKLHLYSMSPIEAI